MGNRITSEHTVVITGGGGYLGAKLAEKLVVKGCRIYLLDLKFNELSIDLNDNNDNISCECLNLINKVQLSSFFEDIAPDFIFHFAALIDRDRSFSIYEHLYDVNVKGTLNLLEAIEKKSYLGFFFSSTSEVYGQWQGIPFNENDKLVPMSPYSLTKLYGEKMIELFSTLNSKPYKIFRIFNFYGPNMPRTTFIGQMLEAYKKNIIFRMTGGEQARDLLSIDDLINQILCVTESRSEELIFNLCSGRSIKMIEIVDAFRKITNNEFRYVANIPYRENEVWETKGDNSKINMLSDVFFNKSLIQGLKECINQ